MSLQVRSRGRLAINLVLELADRSLLGLELTFELSDFLSLELDERIQATGLGIPFVAGTFPGNLGIRCMNRQSREEEQCCEATCP